MNLQYSTAMNKEGGVVAGPQACASCKHQRKKCDETCELAPYFPATKFKEFQNAYRLFGVSGIIKILNSVEPHQRHAAAESIIKEANIRRNDPVHGCLGVVQSLQSQIQLYQKELDLVNQQLLLCRKNELHQQQHPQRVWTNKLSLKPVSVQPTVPHLDHSSSPSSSELPADQFAISYPTTPLPSPVHQIYDPYCQSSEAFCLDETKIANHGYKYPTTLEEGADALEEGTDVKIYDIEPMNQISEADQDEDYPYTSLNEPKGSSSGKAMDYGRLPVDFPHDEQGRLEK